MHLMSFVELDGMKILRIEIVSELNLAFCFRKVIRYYQILTKVRIDSYVLVYFQNQNL